MLSFPPYPSVAVFAAITIATAILLGYTRVVAPDQMLALSALLAAAISIALLPQQRSALQDRRTLPLSIVVIFTSLLLLGPTLTMFVAASGPIALWLMAEGRAGGFGRLVVAVATVMAATQVAGLAHQVLGGTLGT